MKLISRIFLCSFLYIQTHCDSAIFYFGVHKEPKSMFVAGMLNDLTDGIALNIPVLYIQRAVGVSIIVYVATLLYKHRKSLLNLNEPIPECLCDACLDILCEDCDVLK